MKDRRLAVRYASALLSTLSDPQQSAGADRFLAAIQDAMRDSDEFRDLLLNPAVAGSARKAVLASLVESRNLPPQVGNFLNTVIDHNRAVNLPSIAQVFHEQREASLGIVPAEVTTAAPMDDDLKQRTEAALQKLTGRNVQMTCRVEPELLGGAVTKIGSKIYDGSLRGQLKRLRREMIRE